MMMLIPEPRACWKVRKATTEGTSCSHKGRNLFHALSNFSGLPMLLANANTVLLLICDVAVAPCMKWLHFNLKKGHTKLVQHAARNDASWRKPAGEFKLYIKLSCCAFRKTAIYSDKHQPVYFHCASSVQVIHEHWSNKHPLSCSLALPSFCFISSSNPHLGGLGRGWPTCNIAA